jgi:hypothetical protein
VSSERARAPQVCLEARIGLAEIVHPPGEAEKRYHGFGKPGASSEPARHDLDTGEMCREFHLDAGPRRVRVARHRLIAWSLFVFIGRIEQTVAKAPVRPQC